MENALLIGLSRQVVLGHQLDTIANNIANIDTTGFKADKNVFGQYLQSHASDENFNGRDRQVDFVDDRTGYIDMAPGAIERTGSPLDVAIDGNAYFVVQTARGQRYTRNGAFQINGAGQLVTSNGDAVLGQSGPITFQNTDHDINISLSGIITVQEGNSTIDAQRGTLQLASFANPQVLQKDGASSFMAPQQCHAQSGAGQHQRGARRDREIERERRRRNGADDRDHPQLYRHRQYPVAGRRPAQKRAGAIVADADHFVARCSSALACEFWGFEFRGNVKNACA